MKFELGQVVNALRDAHPVAAQIDGNWSKVDRTVPRGTTGTVVGLKNESDGQPAGILVRFGGPEEEVDLMRPEDLNMALASLHAKMAQSQEWMQQYGNLLPELWHLITTLKSLQFPVNSKEQLTSYLQFHDNAYLPRAVSALSDQDFQTVLQEGGGAGSLDFTQTWSKDTPVKFEDDTPRDVPVSMQPPGQNTEEEDVEEMYERLMGAGLKLETIRAQGERAEFERVAQTDPLAEFLSKLRSTGFYMGSLQAIQQLASASTHPGAKAVEALNDAEYKELWRGNGLVDAYDRGQRNQFNQSMPPQPKKEPAPKPYPPPMSAPKVEPLPETFDTAVEVNENGNLMSGQMPMYIRPTRGRELTTVKPGERVYVRDTRNPENKGVATVVGATTTGDLVVQMIKTNQTVAIRPIDAQKDARAAATDISMFDIMAQMPDQPAVGLGGGDQAPPGSVLDSTGKPVAPGDYIQPGEAAPDVNQPGSQGRVVDVKPGGDVMYQDDLGNQRVKDPGSQFQVVKQGSDDIGK
jgi:hypothetical protein